MAISTQEDFLIRPVRMEDAEAVTELLNTWSLAYVGVEEHNTNVVSMEWTSPGFDLENSTRLVLTPEGKAVGYIEVWDNNPVPVRVRVWGRVHPDYEGLGIGTQLMERGEARARQAIERAPAEALVVMECGTISTSTSTHDFLRERGMELSRHFYKMRIDMDSAPPAPQWPEGITVKTFVVGQDESKTIFAFDDAFKDHWGYVEQPFEETMKNWQHFMENDEDFVPSLWFMAMDGDEVAGVSLCWPKADGHPEIGWVGVLGVRRNWRRAGLGLALLQHSFGEFWTRGQRSVGLAVDASSLTGATRLYERGGMQVWKQYDNYSKVLRPGKDLTKQAVEE